MVPPLSQTHGDLKLNPYMVLISRPFFYTKA